MATVESLSARLATLETTASHEASAAAVKEAQLAMLLQLREVKASLMAEGGGASGKEVEGLKEENAKLKLKNEKLEYRVQHLIKMLEEEEAKNR
ncbi:hypothetical protein TrVE_jg714 [Triparma verrucosa]|uniref:Uncharacterized protein n=2 Tax=Triparma TaxID=722752 RepID=A0A9W7ESI1_9STRA|nr:hypothetical protein TrST_g3307 [Triparma strigata]GMH94535.1 hypothetical protein TrVE_jg714 [Triparma verrucosa]